MSLFGSTGHVAQVQLDLRKNRRNVEADKSVYLLPGMNIGHLFLQASPQTPFSPFGVEALTCKGTWGCGVVRSFLLVRARYCGGYWYGIFLEYVLMLSSPLAKAPGPRIEGDGHGGRFVRSPCLCLTQYVRHCPLVPVQPQTVELPPQPRESGGDATPRKDTRQDR